MFRKIVSIGMLFSILAVGASGVMMFIIGRPSFTQQMHPSHKLFGLLMVLLSIFHIYFNRKPMFSYLKGKAGVVVASILFVALVVLYGVGLNKDIPPELDRTYIEIMKNSK